MGVKVTKYTLNFQHHLLFYTPTFTFFLILCSIFILPYFYPSPASPLGRPGVSSSSPPSWISLLPYVLLVWQASVYSMLPEMSCVWPAGHGPVLW